MRKSILLASGLLAIGSAAVAQPTAPLDVQVVFAGDAVDSINGASTNAEFDGVAVKGDGTVVYLFDSISTMDGYFSWNGTSAAVFASEAQISPVTSSASANDMDADAAGNLYTNIWTNTSNTQNVWRIPPGGFGSAVNMLAVANRESVSQIEVDAANNRLLVAYNDLNGAVAEDVTHIPLTATDAVPTVIATESAIEAALATITGYVDDSSDDLNTFDMTVQSDGDIIISHGFSSNRQINGSLLKITPAGAVSVFRTADQIITSLGADPNTIDIGSVNVEALSDDQILIHVQFSSNTATLDTTIAVVSADGTSQITLTNNAQMTADSSITTTLVPVGQTLCNNLQRNTMDGKGGDVAANDDYYFYRQGAGTGTAAQNAVLRLAGVRAFLTASEVKDWTLY